MVLHMKTVVMMSMIHLRKAVMANLSGVMIGSLCIVIKE
jgi:hypothetical protein